MQFLVHFQERQDLLRFEQALKREIALLSTTKDWTLRLIPTPGVVSKGCGLSLLIDTHQAHESPLPFLSQIAEKAPLEEAFPSKHCFSRPRPLAPWQALLQQEAADEKAFDSKKERS